MYAKPETNPSLNRQTSNSIYIHLYSPMNVYCEAMFNAPSSDTFAVAVGNWLGFRHFLAPRPKVFRVWAQNQITATSKCVELSTCGQKFAALWLQFVC